MGFIEHGSEILLQPLSKQYIHSICGILKDTTSATAELLLDRKKDREREQAKRKYSVHLSLGREWPDWPSLRALRDHCFIVGPQRARRMVWLLPTYPSEPARCTSTGDPLTRPLPRVLRTRRMVWLLPTYHPPQEGVAKAALYCARRTSTFLSCAFREQEGHLATPHLFPIFASSSK